MALYFILLFLLSLKAYGENTAASNFYFGFMKGSGDGGYVFVMTNFSNVTYNISFEYIGYTIRGNVSKGSPPLFANLGFGSFVEVLSNTFEDRFKSFQVQSDKPISVALLDHNTVSSEFLVLPCHEYSDINRYEYYTVSTSSYSNTTFSEALIIGCCNGTNLTIIPSVDLFLPVDAQLNGSRDTLVIAGSSHTLVLHKKQTLLIGSRGGDDISGTHIVTNKPITLITGHECGGTPDMIANNFCLYMHLQVPPTLTWGKKFILSGFTSHVNFDYTEYVKLITSQDDTIVTTDCNGTTNSIRYSKSGAVGIYEFNILNYCYIAANKPILVVQFPHHRSYTTMVLVPPVEQYLQRIDFDLNYHTYSKFVIIATPEGFSPSAILFNKALLMNWTTIYDSLGNILGYGTVIEMDRGRDGFSIPSSNSVIHTDSNGKISVLVQKTYYYNYQYLLGHSPVLSLHSSVICNFSCNNGECVADNLCRCLDGWTGDYCDQALCKPECSNGYCIQGNTCVCNSGWTSDRCRLDIDECQLSNVCNQTCINTEGSYYCSCESGYQLTSDNYTCEDINECEGSDHNCTHFCVNTPGSYACSCRNGFNIQKNGDCTDIDECSLGVSGCQQHCFNTNGSYICYCDSGYTLNADNTSCNDINECMYDACPDKSTCVNKLGSYECNCVTGYEMNNIGLCRDIDECADNNTHICSQHCINTEGSYNCSCFNGFMQRFKYFCFDINECSNSNLHNCTGNEVCQNTIGGFSCQCKDGYIRSSNGLTCKLQPCHEMLQDPINGMVTCPSGNKTNDTCYYSCDIGYELNGGSAQRTCQSNGRWSGRPPSCYPVSCPLLLPPENGYLQLPCPNVYQSLCIVRCFDGYTFGSTNNTISRVTCGLSSANMSQWNETVNCTKSNPCSSNECLHDGVCLLADNANGFVCNCTGTLYEGERCEKSLILIEPVGFVLKQNTQQVLTIRAKPDNETEYKFEGCVSTRTFGIIAGSYFLAPCAFNLSSNKTSVTVTISKLQQAMIGTFFLKLNTPISPSVPFVIISDKSSSFFANYSDIEPGCFHINVKICPTIDDIKLTSSCYWTNRNELSQVRVTKGIVFIQYDSMKIPLSLAGIETTDSIINSSLPVRRSSNNPTCNVTAMNSSTSCYQYIPSAEDFSEFVKRQSLAVTFLSSIRRTIFPNWLSLDITEDSNALNKLSNTDYLAKLAPATALLGEKGCESLVLMHDTGQFLLLQHNGPLNLTIENELSSKTLQSPLSFNFYCIALHVCSGRMSPLYIGIPPSAQDGIKSINFISNYVNKGWELKFRSATLFGMPQHFKSSIKFWNGITFSQHLSRIDIHYDTLVNMTATGQYSFGMTNVDLSFIGIIRYKYITNKSEANIALLEGDSTLTVGSEIAGSVEKLKLKERAANISIYYQSHSITSCAQKEPSNGASFKLSYVPQRDQQFYLNILKLPTHIGNHQCPVDVFLSLDSNQDMNGLSFYSDCLDVSFDTLLFTGLAHRLYIPMSNDTLCIKPIDFNSLFSMIDFGLVIHSSLINASHMSYNNFIQLLPGNDMYNTALSLGFSRHTANKVGLLHSVKMTIFGTSFVAQPKLNSTQLSFTTTLNISNSHFYMSHIHGLANTNRQWENLIVNVSGFFVTKTGLFMDELERSVVEEMRRLGIAVNIRKKEADKQLANAVAGLVRATNQLMLAQESVTNSSLKLNKTKDSLQSARDQLRETEMNVTSATSEVKEAEEAINIVCQRMTCPLECKNATRKRTVYEDTYYTAEGTCDSVCNTTTRVRVPPYFEPYISWQYIVCCWDVEVACGIESLCETKVCSPVCKYLNSTRPVFNYMLQDIQIPCKVSCPVRQYNTTIERTEEYIDPCGKHIPNLNCTQMSSACDSEREISLRALNKKRRDLVAPLQERNRARNYVLLLEVRENEVANELVLAEELLKSAQTLHTASVIYKNAVEASYNTTLELIRNDQNLYNLIEMYGTNVFNITNITFSVSISETNNPSIFPITISCSIPGESDLQLVHVYQFGQNYSSQKQYIVDDIIDNIFNLPRRRRRQADESGESGREQFEIRCSQLNSINKFVQYMIETLDEVELRGITIQKNLLNVIESVNMTLNGTSISNGSITGNFTKLKVLYGLTDEDIEQSRQESSNMEDEVFDSVQSSYKTLQSEAQMVLNSLNVTLLMRWRSGIELLLQGNGTVAGKPCSGLVDCILVSNSTLDSLISFAPSDTSSVLLQNLPLASQLLLQLATNELLSFSEVRDKLAPMNSIVQDMISNGYWCSTPPEIIAHPVAKINVQIGTRLVLKCTGNSSLTIIYQWRKDGVTLPNTNGDTLMLDDMQVFDEGNYSCEVTNNVGSLQSTNSSVHVFILPQFFQAPSSVITYLGDGNGAYFTCNATSRPDPGWRWYHRSAVDRPWREIIGEETNELLIRNPSSSDKGEYRCLAYNDFGNLSSDPVSLRLISVTAKVLAYNIDISMKEFNNTKLSVTNISVEEQLRSQFKNAVSFGNVTLSQISIREVLIDELLISLKLIGHNVTTISAANTTPLQVIVTNLATSRQKLDRVREELKTYLENSEGFKLEYKDSEYQYSANSFGIDIPEIQCPPGQELYSNRFLCSDCLEGQEQIMKTESRFTVGRIITERVPRCSPCPLNTYQNIGGSGQCKPCPINHITFITGAVSVERCIELCPVNHNSPNGLMPCRPCPIGTYQPRTGETECLPCSSQVDDPLCSKNPCEQPMVIGSCNEKQLKFFYNTSLQQCQPFIFSGCEGSENNFNSLNECSQKCGCPQNESIITECDADPCLSSTCLSAPTAQCFPDYCGNCTSRYYFDDKEVTDTCSCNNGLVPVSCVSSCLPTCQIPDPVCSPSSSCIPGCGCPDGTVYDQIKQTCINPLSCDTCSLPPNPGTCHGTFPRWFYNASSEHCELFYYGGCAGNSNRFTSLQECIQSCGCGSDGVSMSCASDLCKTSSCEAHDNSVCEVDSCSNCTVKHYVGLKEVSNQCDICVLPPDSGHCNGSFNRWYFNKASGHCELFTYGGCQGNGNNFESLSTCLQICASGDKLCDESMTSVDCYSDPCKTTHCPNHDNAICIPNHCGECSAHYYNSTGHDITMICSDCPPEQPAAKCFINLCDHKTCPNLPPTQCVLDVCGECKARYYWNNVDVTEFCMTCPAQGQIFKDCGGSCERTCNDILLQKPFVCSKHYCIPGCACPAGQVLDEANNKCVYQEQCPCQRSCDPIPNNCTRIYYDNCNCSLCRDCPITGQEYNEVSAHCPKTCSNPHLLCAGEGEPGCSCPLGQVIDEINNRCVQSKDCPKPDPCTLVPERGPCTASITRYHYNVTSQTCQQFSYGGCFPNENNFFTKHDCEEKCSDCYPVCTPEYCAIKRGGTCSVPSSHPGSTQGCPGGCAISNCGACYYSYNDLPFPPLPASCPSVCPFINGEVDESCMARWGRCVQRSYFNIYKSVSERERFKENFRCWSHQCIN